MKIKEYRNNFASFKYFIEKHKNPLNAVAEYAAVSFVPVVVLYKFLEEIIGPSEEITSRIEENLKNSGHKLEEE